MMWDIHKDYAQMNLARVQFRDVELLRDMGLNGYISCQLTRSFFPSGLCNTLLGRKLFDRSLPYEEAERCYFEDAYGEEWEDARALLWDISDGFSWSYSRGELPVVHPETAALLKETPAKLYAWAGPAARPQLRGKRYRPDGKCGSSCLRQPRYTRSLRWCCTTRQAGLANGHRSRRSSSCSGRISAAARPGLQEVFDLCTFGADRHTGTSKKEDEAAIGFDEKAI